MTTAGRLHSRLKGHAGRESELALLVIVCTTLITGLGGNAILVALPGLLFPAWAFLAHGHVLGRRAGTTSVVTAFGALILVLTSDSIRPAEAALPALLGMVAFGVSNRIERTVIIPQAAPATSEGRWLTVEVDQTDETARIHPVSIPATLIRGHDLHMRIARRRNLSTVAARRA